MFYGVLTGGAVSFWRLSNFSWSFNRHSCKLLEALRVHDIWLFISCPLFHPLLFMGFDSALNDHLGGNSDRPKKYFLPLEHEYCPGGGGGVEDGWGGGGVGRGRRVGRNEEEREWLGAAGVEENGLILPGFSTRISPIFVFTMRGRGRVMVAEIGMGGMEAVRNHLPRKDLVINQ